MTLYTHPMPLRRIYLLRSSKWSFTPCAAPVASPALRFRRLGSVDLDTVEKVEVVIKDEEKARLERLNSRPALSEILNLHDFEVC